MSNLSPTVKIAADLINSAVGPYRGLLIDSNQKELIINMMKICIKDLNLDEFQQLLNCVPSKYKGILKEAGKRVNLAGTTYQGDRGRHTAEVRNNETFEDLEERILEQERNFFFQKDKTNAACTCGAAYTEFPQIHSEHCELHESKKQYKHVFQIHI